MQRRRLKTWRRGETNSVVLVCVCVRSNTNARVSCAAGVCDAIRKLRACIRPCNLGFNSSGLASGSCVHPYELEWLRRRPCRGQVHSHRTTQSDERFVATETGSLLLTANALTFLNDIFVTFHLSADRLRSNCQGFHCCKKEERFNKVRLFISYPNQTGELFDFFLS